MSLVMVTGGFPSSTFQVTDRVTGHKGLLKDTWGPFSDAVVMAERRDRMQRRQTWSHN